DLVPARAEVAPPEREPAVPGAELAGVNQPDVSVLLGQAAEMAPSAQESLNRIRASLERLEKMAPLIEDTLKEYRERAKESRRTGAEVQQTARTWDKLGERLDLLTQENERKITRIVDSVDRVFNEQNRKNLADTLDNLRNGTTNLPALSKN